METRQFLQLVPAVIFALLGVMFLLRSRTRPDPRSLRLGGILMLVVAAINAALAAGLFE